MPVAVARVRSARFRWLGACVWLASSLLICVTTAPADDSETERVAALRVQLDAAPAAPARVCPSISTRPTPEELAELARLLDEHETRLREAHARASSPRSP